MKGLILSAYLVFARLLLIVVSSSVLAGVNDNQIEIFNNVRTVRIQLYCKRSLNLSLEEDTKRMLNYAGIEVVPDNSQNYDATLVIFARGKVIGVDPYITNVPNFGWCEMYKFSEVTLLGEISFEIPGGKVYKDDFKGIHKVSGSASVNDFYFSFIYEESSFAAKLLRMIEKIYGIKPLIRAFGDQSEYIRKNAIEVVGEIGIPALKHLVIALKHEDSRIRAGAVNALKNITGQDFGENPTKWQEWWEKNKSK